MTTVAPAEARTISRRASGPLDPVDVRWMVGLGAVALVLRVWFVLSVGQTQFTFNDAYVYHTIAANIASGHGFTGIWGQPTAQWPPGWPFLLALMYTVFGAHPTAGELLNAGLGAATVPLMYFAARRTLGRTEAIVVGVGMTILLGQIFWSDVLVAENMATFEVALLLAMLGVLPAGRPRSALLVGAVLGAATLTRGEGFLLLAIPVAMWWGELSRPVLRRQVLVMVAVMLAFVIPWTVRNAFAMHAFVPLSTDIGGTLWAGHNPTAYGGPEIPPQRLLNSIKVPPHTPQYELASNTFLRNKALSWAVSHPLDEIGLIPKKVLAAIDGDGQAIYFWIDAQATSQRPVLSQHAQGRLASLANGESYVLLVTFFASIVVFGKALWRRRPILRGALVLLTIQAVLLGFVFYGNFRYIAPLEPLMLMVAAPLIARLSALRAQRLG